MSESAKIRARLMPLLEGKTVLDLGCGDEKIVPWAVGVDDGSEWGVKPAAADVLWSVAPGSALLTELELIGRPIEFDVVFSSHTIEHMRAPILNTLRYWASFVKVGGALALYQADEARYVFNPDNPRQRNPAHMHYLTPETFRWYCEQLAGFEIEEFVEETGKGCYSFLVVIRRVR